MIRPLFFVILFFSFAQRLFAAGDDIREYPRQFPLGPSQAAMIIIGFERDAAGIEKLTNLVIDQAREALNQLSVTNPSGEIGRFNAEHGGKSRKLSDNAFALVKAATRVAEWTGGAFDPVVSGTGTFRSIKLNDGSHSIQMKEGVQLNFDRIINGFMADVVIRLIYAGGMQNAMVKVGNIFRGLGMGLHGPWTIQVQDNEGTYAHHALNVSVSNTGLATVSASEFRGSSAPLRCRGVTIAAKEAAIAEGLAHAVFVLGTQEGLALLGRIGQGKGLIVDIDGKFHRYGF